MSHLTSRYLAGADETEREGRQAKRRREQQVIALEEPPQRIDHRLAGGDRPEIVHHARPAEASAYATSSGSIWAFCSGGASSVGAGLSAAVERPEDQARIAEVRARLFHLQTDLREGARRGRGDLSRLRLDRRKAEVG